MKYRKTEHIVTRKVAGETLLVPVKGQLADLHKVFTLNTVAEWVWENLDGQRSAAELGDGLHARFAVARPTAEADLAELLAKLEQAGLIEPVRA
ncbi:MAG: PqqD family protein [Verrucomicrobiota bacterium]